MSSDIAIQAEGVGKSYAMFERPDHRLKQMLFGRWRTYYEQFWALRAVDLEIRQGESWGIIGRNGSGKSTLLQIICGNLTPTIGTVTVRGRISALLELGAGFNPEFTGRQNVYINGIIAGYEKDDVDERMDDILAFADIGPFIDQPVKTYSSGMFARLAFAIAINVNPDILIVDEALAVGDEAFQRKCFARMERIRGDGATILFVSHATGSVIDLCDHGVLLHRGEHLYTGRPKQTVAWYQKLMAAPDDRAISVLAEIRARAQAAEPIDTASVKAPVDEPSALSANPQDMKFAAQTVDTTEQTGTFLDDTNSVSQAEAAEPPVEGAIKTSTVHSLEMFPAEAATIAPDDVSDAPSTLVSMPERAESDSPTFDPNLESVSIIEFAPNGAKISDIRVLTLLGEQVNCLVSNERYRLCYRVTFFDAAENVKFYCMAKMVNGTHLGGGTFPLGRDTYTGVAAGEVVDISFEFDCMFDGGTYFFNCGIAARGEILHRVLDALIFRVGRPPPSESMGTIDLNVLAEFASSGPNAQERMEK
jgi:lipopolysaccharide transport system ATP-binding protein